MIAINTYCCDFVILLLISSQLCSINASPVIDNNVIEMKVVSKLMIGKSDNSSDIKRTSIPSSERPKMAVHIERSSELDQLISLMNKKDNRLGMPTIPVNHRNRMNNNMNPNNHYRYRIPHPVIHNPNNVLFNQNKYQNEFDNNISDNKLKKFDIKSVFLKKILGDTYTEEDEDKDGFFGTKHLRRHGAAGMWAKILGELIGIKIRESIEDFGKTISDYAKDFTQRGFVSIGNSFGKVIKSK